MSGGGSSTPVVQTQTKDPWTGQQPYLNSIFKGASDLYQNNIGYQPWTGNTVADIYPWLQMGLQNQANVGAQSPTGTANNLAAQGLAGSVIGNQGINSGIQSALGGLGGLAPQYQGLADAGGLNAGLNTDLQGLSNVTSGVYGNILANNNGQTNPYLQGAIDAQGRKIADQVNSAMSGAGRYGSGAHTNVLSRNLAEAADPILAQDWQNRQQNQLAAAQGMLSGLGQQAGINQQAIQNQLNAQGAQTGLYNNMANIYQQGLNQAGQYSQLSPNLDLAAYMPTQQLISAGQQMQDRAQAQLTGQINQYNAQQAWPWEQLQREAAIIQGGGNLGGTTVTSTPTGVGAGQSGLGGALAGASVGSAFGPYGAALGAAGGGLLGYLGGR